MIGASSLSGDTLIACHFPVVQLPTWQLPVQALCSSAKRPGRLCSVGLTRAVSLPEQESLNREHAFTGGRKHFSSSYSSLNEDRAEEEGASDSSGRYDSTSSPEETSSHLKKESSGGKGGSLRSHNSFLPNTELDEDEEDEDSDGDNLHRYHEDSSFVLHGNSNWPLNNGARNYTMPHGDMDSEWGNEGTVLGAESNQEWLSNQPNQLDSPQTECQCFHVSRSGITMMACGEPDSDRLKDNMSCCIHGQHKCSPELLSNSHAEYVSDSSCNSSDGVLVNFCTIYNRSNNPATPHDLSSPAVHPSQSCEGSVFLNLQPVPQTPNEDLRQDDMTVNSSPKEEVGVKPSASCWSPQGLDSNCNLYSLEPLPPGLSSLEVSDLTACLRSQATLAMGTNQKYYKLVTCDLSSQSPSPAWSSLTSCPEGQSRISPFPPPELFNHHKKEGQHKEVKKETEDQQEEKRFSSAQCSAGFDSPQFPTYDYQVATTSTDKALCRKKHTDSIQNLSHTPCSRCPSQCSPHSSKCQDTSAMSTQPSVILDQEHCNTDATEKGACSSENVVVRYSKAQRPTSLPIQPFVLIPADKPQSQAQHLGCLLEQYINHKSSKSSSSRPGFKGKGKSRQCFSNLQPSPMGSHCPIFLEGPSSSDTCSTCTPSPECFSRRHTWSQSSRNQGRQSPCTSKSSLDPSHSSIKPKLVQVQDKTSPYSGETQTNSFVNLISGPNQSHLVKIPTYQDLINLTPEQSHAKLEPESPHQSQNHTSYHSIFSHTPPTLPLTTDTHHPNLQVSSSPPTILQPEKKCPQFRATPAADSGFFHGSFAAALSSVAPLSSLSSLLSLAASGLHPQQMQDSAGLSGKHSQSQHSDSLILSDRPPTEFCLSPDTSYESLSISHLQRRGLLRSVSRAVDLIMAHFGSSRDPEEKMRLGNSSCSPTIAGLVLEHLCPTIQNILEDGLRDHKLDLIIGQRRNHCWTLVEVSTRIGPSTRVLHSLVTKIRQCPQLTSHCMRLRAFIMGLLNLRALEFWLSHLQSQKGVVTTYYHSWGFLSMSLGRCQPLFQELLLLLQPLSVLPFDLNLLLEPRLLRDRQLCPEEQRVSPPPPCSALLVTSWPLLQADRKVDSSHSSQQTKISHQIGLRYQESLSPLNSSCIKQQYGGMQSNRSPLLAPIPEWWPKEPDLMDGVVEGEDCSQNYADTWSQISMDSRQEERRRDKDTGTPNVSICVQAESPGQGGLRWAKLFGAADTSTRAETVSLSHTGAQTRRRPSQWLHLDKSQLGLLAQSIKSMKLVGAQTDKNKDY
ncbi:iporin-like [Seriola dumerili]|uniref:iporin-like n=1 Tax=Seriola dumerili TaxID=41447 RepID=UPI000BBECB7F|nr:iporin-like [Seriola dumerili]